MITAYFIDPWGHDHMYSYQKEIDEIKRLNPDKIFCMCMHESLAHVVFQHFIDGIQVWLAENNKTVVILSVGPDGFNITPNIINEKTFGCYTLTATMCATIEKDTEKSEWFNSHKDADKWFTCYNNCNKYERALLIDQLAKYSLLQHGIVTFHGPTNVLDLSTNEIYQWQYHDGSRLVDEEDFVLHSRPEYSAIEFPKSYLKGLIDVVSETSYSPNLFNMTEKTGKPLATLKPFIVLSCAGYHKHLVDDYGMVLYDEIFDYSFDSKDDVNDRIQGIIDNLNRIVSMDISKIKEIQQTLLPKLLYNRRKLLEYGNHKEKMVPKSLEFLTTTSDYKLYGSVVDSTLFDRIKPWLMPSIHASDLTG